MMLDEETVALSDLPPSAKLVFLILNYEGSLTQKELREKSRLSQRTVRAALQRLKDHGIVEEGIHISDARQSLYTLSESAVEAKTADSLQ